MRPALVIWLLCLGVSMADDPSFRSVTITPDGSYSVVGWSSMITNGAARGITQSGVQIHRATTSGGPWTSVATISTNSGLGYSVLARTGLGTNYWRMCCFIGGTWVDQTGPYPDGFSAVPAGPDPTDFYTVATWALGAFFGFALVLFVNSGCRGEN